MASSREYPRKFNKGGSARGRKASHNYGRLKNSRPSIERNTAKPSTRWFTIQDIMLLIRRTDKPELETEYHVEGDGRSNSDSHAPGINIKKIRGVASIEQATEDDLAFCSWEGEHAIQLISQSKAGIILCSKDLKGFVHPRTGAQLVFVDNPRQAFVRFGNKILKDKEEESYSTMGSATLPRPLNITLNNNPTISPYATISKNNVRIHPNCRIGNYVTIGDDCTVGDNTVIHDRVTLLRNCEVGKNCIIQSGVTLGEDGFAYERYNDNALEKFPHFGRVIIEDNVEIYSNSNIARGSLSDTVIGDSTKIDSLVHIAHNVKIGRNCMLAAGTVIGGSTVIGDTCWTGLNSTIKHHITLGANVLVGAGAVVIHDVPPNEIVAGVPAKSIKDKVTSPEIFMMAGLKGRNL